DAECLNDESEQWRRLLSAEFDPRTTVVLERSIGCTKHTVSGLLRGPDVEVVALETMYVRLRVNMDRPGYVVLTDTYYPGWQVRVNDKPAAILRANGMLRAVRVPEGPVDIVFKYVPVSFYAGVAVAVGAILFMALGAWVERRHAMRTDREMSEGGSQNTLA
ncbi:MAG: YfhO family protein, partial [Dehalococcoidia bacterium]